MKWNILFRLPFFSGISTTKKKSSFIKVYTYTNVSIIENNSIRVDVIRL